VRRKEILMAETTNFLSVQSFRGKLLLALRNEAGSDAKIILERIPVNNGILREAFAVKMPALRITPLLYIDESYEKFRQGRSIDSLAAEFIHSVFGICGCAQTIDCSSYQSVRSGLALRVINSRRNADKLKDMPHRDIEDLSIVCFYAPKEKESPYEGHLLAIDRQLLDLWGITEETLFRDAMDGAVRDFPPKLTRLEDELGEIWEKEKTEEAVSETDVFVLTNTHMVFGAACMFYPGLLSSFAQKTGCNLIILPSSIHEVLLIPEVSGRNYKGLGEVVRSVNSDVVEEKDILSDYVYYYDRNEDRVRRMADW
jgi:hypothetical protein